MASRPIWRGHLRLALVSCPVGLYNARHDRSNIQFNLINPETGNRIRMITQDAETGDEVQRRDLVKGYEFKKNQYVLLGPASELEITPASTLGGSGGPVRPGRRRRSSAGSATRWPTSRSPIPHSGH